MEEETSPPRHVRGVRGGGLWLHEARARTFPPSSTLSQRRRTRSGSAGVDGGGFAEGGERKRMRERESERKKKEEICRANSRAR